MPEGLVALSVCVQDKTEVLKESKAGGSLVLCELVIHKQGSAENRIQLFFSSPAREDISSMLRTTTLALLHMLSSAFECVHIENSGIFADSLEPALQTFAGSVNFEYHFFHLSSLPHQSHYEASLTWGSADDSSSGDESESLISGHSEVSKRKEGEETPRFELQRRMRTAFTSHQISKLEKTFERQRYLEASERKKLAACLQLSEIQVKTWFQNRRMKFKRQIQDQQHGFFPTPSLPGLYSYEQGPFQNATDYQSYSYGTSPQGLPSLNPAIHQFGPVPLYTCPQSTVYPFQAPNLHYFYHNFATQTPIYPVLINKAVLEQYNPAHQVTLTNPLKC
uniref:Homeobox protein pv.1-like n=1 Tax=Geotrypetes seraphini TaxID=260995 RepID=A0A6P8RBP6_GEOSA|nr:homeobox protein pv.1-like [Geotrypetes seraphini]